MRAERTVPRAPVLQDCHTLLYPLKVQCADGTTTMFVCECSGMTAAREHLRACEDLSATRVHGAWAARDP